MGKVVREVKVASEPEALVRYFDELGLPVGRFGLEAGPLSQWLHAGLIAAGREVVLLETRHVKAALSAMTVKTDRKDARGIAQLLRMGWYRPGGAARSRCILSLFASLRHLYEGPAVNLFQPERHYHVRHET